MSGEVRRPLWLGSRCATKDAAATWQCEVLSPPRRISRNGGMSTLRKRRSQPEDAAGRRSPGGQSVATPAAAAPKTSSLAKFVTRVVMGALMITGFVLILYGGHMYAWGLVVVLQTLLFRELVNVRYRAAAEKNIPWFRSVQVSDRWTVDNCKHMAHAGSVWLHEQWVWFGVALFFSYGDSFGAFLENRKIRFVPPVIVYYLRYHTWVSFSMYATLFVVSVLSLKKGADVDMLHASCPCLN